MAELKDNEPMLLFAETDQVVYCPHGDCRYKEMFSNPGTFEVKCYGCDKSFEVRVIEPRKLFIAQTPADML